MRRVSLCVAAVSLALLAGCGGDDDESSSETEGATGTTDVTTTEDTTALDTTTQDTTTEDGSDNGDRSTFNEQLRENLIDVQGLTESQANCVIAELERTLSDEQVQELLDATNIDSAEDLDPEIQDILFQAGAKCANE